MTREAVIGLDIGTTSAKAVAFTADGAARGSGSRAYGLQTPRPGYAEQDPDAVLDGALAALAGAAHATREAGHEIVGVALSAAMHGLIGLDERDQPITPLLTWADARAGDQARRLRASSRGLALHRRTGTPIHPMSPLVKLRWHSEEAPDTARRARRWVGAKERLIHRLTGEWVIDHGIASATGLFNLADEDWDPEALAWARVDRDRLPQPVPTTTVLRLHAEGARAVGLAEGCPVVVGAADGPLANLGLGAIRPGAVACSIGTSGALRVASDTPRVDPRGRVFCYALAPGRWIVGGAVNNGGSVLDWARAALAPELAEARGREAVPALVELAAQAPPGSGGLLFVPHLLGERAPRWSAGARGAYLGLTRTHGRPELLRAQLEGVCLQLALVLAALTEAGTEVTEIRATGGFSRSPLWRRILAGVFGRPIGFATSPEGSGLGAALLGMYALGTIDDLDRAADIVRIESVERPDPVEREIYARVLAIYERAVEDIVATSEALAALQESLPRAAPRAGAEPRGLRHSNDAAAQGAG